MFNPDFDPLAELEHHAIVINHQERTIQKLINKSNHQEQLIADLAKANQDIVELVIGLQNTIKFIREELDASN